jgi:hypothetical protein
MTTLSERETLSVDDQAPADSQAGDVAEGTRVSIGFSRRVAFSGAVVCTYFLVIGIVHFPSAESIAVQAVVVGGMAVLLAQLGLRRTPLLIVDNDGLMISVRRRDARFLSWSDIADLYIREIQRQYGLERQLVVVSRDGYRNHLTLFMLSMRWRKIRELVERKSGRTVDVRREHPSPFRD